MDRGEGERASCWDDMLSLVIIYHTQFSSRVHLCGMCYAFDINVSLNPNFFAIFFVLVTNGQAPIKTIKHKLTLTFILDTECFVAKIEKQS